MNEYEVVVTTTTLMYVHADTVDDAVEAAANMYLQMDQDNVEYDILSCKRNETQSVSGETKEGAVG